MFTSRFFYALPVLLLTLLFSAHTAEAATIYLTPETATYQVGQSFDVDVRINSTDKGFNAAELSVLFPKDVLEVKSLTYAPGVSVFNFWLDTPYFSNTSGIVGFIGGATQPVVSSSAVVLKISFIAKNVGDAVIAISDAAVTASDGTGTNILTGTQNARFIVIPSSTTPEAPVAAPTQPVKPEGEKVQTVPTPSTQPIVRTPTPTAKLPTKPKIFVPLFPDPLKWSSVKSSFIVAWDLPTDVTDISAIVNESKTTNPPEKSQGLFEAKEFPALKDGVWYAHVMFKNKNGWGPAAHYRIGVDQVAPEAFKISSDSGLVTDSPTPTIHFATSDNLSGIEKYVVQINEEDPVVVTKESLKLEPQTPGLKNISVQAVDGAGNSTKATIAISIQPIASPTIVVYTKNPHFGDSMGMVAGTSLPKSVVDVLVKNTSEQIVLQLATTADDDGNWSAQISRGLVEGSYYLEVIAKDARGAQSLLVRSEIFKVHERPLITIGALDVTLGMFYGILLSVFILGGIFGGFFYRAWRNQMRRRELIAQRDISNIVGAAKSVLNKAITNLATHKNKVDHSETKYLLEDLYEKISKAEKYIIENIKEIGD